MSLLKRLLVGVGILGYLAGCPDKPPQPAILEKPLSQLVLDNEKFDLDNAKIIQHADYGSQNIVAFIADIHYVEDIQREIYQTLKELASENNSKFVGLEGFVGEFSEYKLQETSKYFQDNFLLLADLKYFKTEEEFEKIVDKVCFYYGKCSAGEAFELVEGDKIFSHGIETKELYQQTVKIVQRQVELIGKLKLIRNNLENMNEEEQLKLIDGIILSHFEIEQDVKNIVVIKRSHVFVDNLLKEYNNWKQQGNESKVLMLIGGGEHYESIAEHLDKLKQSYVIIKPNNYDKIFDLLIQKQKNQK
jgi:flavodoxin